MADKKLTAKQKLFANEYLVDLNATRAYKSVYKSCKKDESAKVNGSRLLTNANVAAYIAERMKDREKRTGISQDMVLNELASIAFANGTDFAKVINQPIIQEGKYVIDPDTGKVKTYQTVSVISTEQLPEEKKKAIAGIKEGKYGVEVAQCDKVKALELIGRHLGMWNDKIDLKVAPSEETIKELEDIFGTNT